MFSSLVSTSLKHRLFVLAAALVLILYGSITLPLIPVDGIDCGCESAHFSVGGPAPENADRRRGQRRRVQTTAHKNCDFLRAKTVAHRQIEQFLKTAGIVIAVSEINRIVNR